MRRKVVITMLAAVMGLATAAAPAFGEAPGPVTSSAVVHRATTTPIARRLSSFGGDELRVRATTVALTRE